MAESNCGCSYIGRGKIYLRNLTDGGQRIHVGNATDLAINTDTSEVVLPDYALGGNCNKVTRIDAVSATFTLFNLCFDSLGIAFRGGNFKEEAETIAAETVSGLVATQNSAFAPFANIPDPDQAVSVSTVEGNVAAITVDTAGSGYESAVVTIAPPASGVTATAKAVINSAGEISEIIIVNPGSGYATAPAVTITSSTGTGAAATAVLSTAGALAVGTDFVRSSSGIVLLKTGSFTAGDIEVGYEKPEQCRLEGLTDAAKNYELIFEGLNEANSNSPVTVKLNRLVFAPGTDWSLIGTEFASIEFEGELLSDDSVTGDGLSKFFSARKLDC